MKTSSLAFIFMFILSTSVFSGPRTDPDDQMINPFWDFYSNNYLSTQSSGKGFTGIASENDISGANMNPASINIGKKFQINVQYTYKSKQPWLPSLNVGDLSLAQQIFSGSVGFGYRVNSHFQIGLVYSNPTGMKFNLGEVIRTDEFGNEIGRYDAYDQVTQHSFTIPLTYSNEMISVGANLNYSLYQNRVKMLFTTIEDPEGINSGDDETIGNSGIFRAQAGFIYHSPFGLSIGTTVTSGGNSSVTYEYPNIMIEKAKTYFPWKAGFGLQYKFHKSAWKISADYNFTGTSIMDNLKDRHDVHIGVENDISKNITLRAGFFTLLDYRKSDINWLDPAGEYDQYFATFGGSFKKKGLTINLALLTSEFSPGMIKNTIINGGVTFDF